MKTYMANAQNTENNWYLVDAANQTLGRLASKLASRLRGKHKPEFTPHTDTGDYLVVVNVDKLKVTGNKANDKIYYRHSGYTGSMKSESFQQLHARKPEQVLEIAIKGMLPKGPLGRDMMRKLKLYAGVEHPHQAQQPEKIDL